MKKILITYLLFSSLIFDSAQVPAISKDMLPKMSNIEGKNILIVDDICSKGGTFYFSAKKLKELGAKNIYLHITHCENTIFDGELLTSGLIKRIFTTDSIFTRGHEIIETIRL